jgi:vancomycin resistance protein YoaR
MLIVERVQGANPPRYQVAIDPTLLRAYLTDLAPSFVRSPQDARFTFNDQTKQLELLQPAVIGRSLDIDATIQAINDKLVQGEHNVALVFKEVKPAVTDDKTGDQLGIRELVQSTTTYFYGSSTARIQNITTAASRFHGLLVAPGETFSMAQALGDISLDNGYAEALIILGNQTIQGVGGGVCQVSTTLFRTAFFAGYPINERHPHAYRVGYYEEKSNGASDPKMAGLDATVFVPLVDFKFTNDTPYWLLMETYVKGYSLTWKFYSTSDGRSVDWTTTGPTNTVPAPAPLYRENPDLAQGQINQVDYAAEGADITVTRTVTKNGNTYLQDQFVTHYAPWQAVYEYGPGTQGIPTSQPTP